MITPVSEKSLQVLSKIALQHVFQMLMLPLTMFLKALQKHFQENTVTKAFSITQLFTQSLLTPVKARLNMQLFLKMKPNI